MELIRTATGLVGLEKTTFYVAMIDGSYQKCGGYLATVDGISVILHRWRDGLWHTTDPDTGLSLPWRGTSRKNVLDQLTPNNLVPLHQYLNTRRRRDHQARLAEYRNTHAE